MSWYLRFQTTERCSTTGWPFGIFRGSGQLRAIHPDYEAYEDWVEKIFAWFNANLAVPKRDQFDRRAVFWFVPEAREYVSAAWSLTAAYREAGITINVRRTDCPGRIVYQDHHQIAAIPYWPYGRGPPPKSKFILSLECAGFARDPAKVED